MGSNTTIGRPLSRFGNWVQEETDELGQKAKDLFKPPKAPKVADPPPPPSAADAAIRAAIEAARRRAGSGGRASTFLTGARGAAGAAPVTPPRLVGK